MGSSGQVHLRPFRVSDLDTLQRLIYVTIDTSYRTLCSQTALAYLKGHHSREHILADALKGHTLIVECDGQIVGTGSLVGSSVRRLCVSPPHRQQGLGRDLVRALEAHAIKSGVREIELEAFAPSETFYGALGYTVVERSDLRVGEEECVPYARMVKRLIP